MKASSINGEGLLTELTVTFSEPVLGQSPWVSGLVLVELGLFGSHHPKTLAVGQWEGKGVKCALQL